MPTQGQEEEDEAAVGGAEPRAAALGVAVAGVAAVDAHPGCSGSIPHRLLTEGAERAGLHHTAWNRAQ